MFGVALTGPPLLAEASEFRAPPWLAGGHSQTIYSSLLAPTPRVVYRRERWDTPDGDFIDLDWIDGPADAPLVAVFHGLEGSSRSHYALHTMRALAARGWRGVVPHFRGCSGEPNRAPRAYHSGDFEEIDWIARRLRARAGAAPLFLAGFSLGGNALLKWCGETGRLAASVARAAAAVSAPLDLHAAGDALERGFNRVYTHNFLRTLKPNMLAKLERFPGLFDAAALRRARTMREFDDIVTAPLHGFRDTDDYWKRSSSKPVLGAIAVPSLIVNACNDPFLPAAALPTTAQVSAHTRLLLPRSGGHVGFVDGAFPGDFCWLTGVLLSFFEETL